MTSPKNANIREYAKKPNNIATTNFLLLIPDNPKAAVIISKGKIGKKYKANNQFS